MTPGPASVTQANAAALHRVTASGHAFSWVAVQTSSARPATVATRVEYRRAGTSAQVDRPREPGARKGTMTRSSAPRTATRRERTAVSPARRYQTAAATAGRPTTGATAHPATTMTIAR